MCILVVHLPSECLIHQQVWENIVLYRHAAKNFNVSDYLSIVFT